MILLSNTFSSQFFLFLWEEFKSFLLQFNSLSFFFNRTCSPRATGSVSISPLWWRPRAFEEEELLRGQEKENVSDWSLWEMTCREFHFSLYSLWKSTLARDYEPRVKPQGSTVVPREAQGRPCWAFCCSTKPGAHWPVLFPPDGHSVGELLDAPWSSILFW